jgi:hypothetical protein
VKRHNDSNAPPPHRRWRRLCCQEGG